MSRFLGLDVGTQGTKGLLIDLERGEVVARASASYGLIEGLPVGAAEQAPETWWRAVRDVVHALVATAGADAEPIAGIGVSGQQHGFVALDAEREVLRPAKLWCDTSTAKEAQELSDALGRSVPAGFTASKILWMKRYEPERFARLRHVLLPHDWIDLRLTGELWAECGDASGTGFFDGAARDYDRASMEAIDPSLAGWMPTLVAPNAPASTLSTDAAADLGLPAGIPVAPGGGDNMMSAIGSGAVRSGEYVVSLGTSGTVFTHSSDPIESDGLIAPFCDSTGGWLPLLCVMNATGVTEEVRRAFDADVDGLTQAARDVSAGCDGLLFVPYLAGERVPDLPDATGTLLGIRSGSLSPARLFRAALEGTSLNIAWGIERMRALGLEPDAVRVVGGGARNELWCQILAALLDVHVQRSGEPEAAALGAALQAAWVVTAPGGSREQLIELSAPFVAHSGRLIAPDELGGDARPTYRALAERFPREVARLYPADERRASRR